MAISAVLATVGAFAIPLAATSALAASAAAFKKGDNQKKDAKKRQKKARLEALAQKQSLAASRTVRGQGGAGTLLTGAGGLSDPALTGKQTLLGTQ